MNGMQIDVRHKGLIAPDELVILMGPPGAGKDVHAEALAREAGGVYRSTGDLLRAENDPRINEIMATGALVPEEELQRVLAQALRSLEGQPVVLAGVTKKPREAEWLLGLLPEIDRRILVVIQLRATKRQSRHRVTTANRGRADDDPAVFERRWMEYIAETLHSIEVYRRALLVDVVYTNSGLPWVYEAIVSAVSARRTRADASARLSAPAG